MSIKSNKNNTTDSQKSQDELDHFFDLSLDMLCIASKDGYFHRLNPAFKEVLGHEIEDLLKKPFVDFVHPDDVESTLKELESLNLGLPTVNFENRYLCKDGTYKWLSWRSMPHPDGHLYAVARDITKNKEEEGNLKKIVENLRRSNEELEQFAYIASHDLQEPLRKITNFSGLFMEKYGRSLDETGKKYIDYMVDGSQRMSQLINDLLMYSRIGRENVEMENIDLNDLIQRIFSDIHDSNHEITLDCKKLVHISSYRTQMVQLFSNLFNNSMKFHSDKPLKIFIDVEMEENDFYHFRFGDNGIGIEKLYHQQIFGMFRKLHSRSAYSGSGIGLSICKKIVEQHGGKMWVESDLDTGSIFHFTLMDLKKMENLLTR